MRSSPASSTKKKPKREPLTNSRNLNNQTKSYQRIPSFPAYVFPALLSMLAFFTQAAGHKLHGSLLPHFKTGNAVVPSRRVACAKWQQPQITETSFKQHSQPKRCQIMGLSIRNLSSLQLSFLQCRAFQKAASRGTAAFPMDETLLASRINLYLYVIPTHPHSPNVPPLRPIRYEA